MMNPAVAVAFLIFAAWCGLLLLQDHMELAWSSPWRHAVDGLQLLSTGSGERPALTEEQQQALREICGSRLQKELRQWLRSLCVAHDELDDAAQTVTEEAIRSLPTFDPARGSARVWLHGIALRQGAAHRARAKRHRAKVEAETIVGVTNFGEREDERPGAEELLVAEGARAELRATIRQLPPIEADVLLGHDLDGIAMTEIARAHGIAASTAYKLRARALEMLRALLRGEG
jgi:RNA polymerase sigma factor (sigma-70 family)